METVMDCMTDQLECLCNRSWSHYPWASVHILCCFTFPTPKHEITEQDPYPQHDILYYVRTILQLPGLHVHQDTKLLLQCRQAVLPTSIRYKYHASLQNSFLTLNLCKVLRLSQITGLSISRQDLQ